ncbi:ZIP family metal transporter [Sphingomonas sp.]|uniref:ZIP family metal transporter n=1 Tax=Sphingomonas sp. TaxID=28214 RepID=UPI003B00B60B
MIATTPLDLAASAGAATLAGGVLALRLRRGITLVLGLTAGVVLGVALFDLLPEALRVGDALGGGTILVGVAAGLVGYMLLDRTLGAGGTPRSWRAHLGPASLALHSFIDGLGIGLAFHVSPEIAWLVAIAVLTHDVADGVNIVSLCIAADRRKAARFWLAADALSPIAGAFAGTAIHLPATTLSLLLAFFAGAFLYIGACELMPRSHALDPRMRTSLASLIGMALMYGVTLWAR